MDRPVDDARFSLEILTGPAGSSTLAEDVRRGLSASPKTLPPKHFYDDRGSRLFDSICDLPEYYLTRTEHALLRRSAADILTSTDPRDLLELGSGTSRKTRLLLDAAGRRDRQLRYVPVDVCEPLLREIGRELLQDYSWLEVHAVVADYERELEHLPRNGSRLVAFLGSTFGNFPSPDGERFLERIAGVLCPGEHFLIGADLVKSARILETAYNDTGGLTAEFNRNVLHVINRELDADFVAERFEHLAFFDAARSQIEMHLRSREPQEVTIRKLDMTVRFDEGETIHTETSRKFSREELDSMCRDAGLEPRRWYAAPDDAFALLLARK